MALSSGFDWSVLKGIDWKKIDGLEPWERVLKERFPALAWVLDHDELASVIRKAVDQKWTEGTFTANLQASKWWKDRTESQRTWDIFAGADGNAAELAERRSRTIAELEREASLLGLTIPPDAYEAIATRVLRDGVGDSERRTLLMLASPDTDPGAITATTDSVKAIARRYMVSISDAEADRLTRRMIKGELDATNIEETMKELAKSRHPSLRLLIDADVSPEEHFRPHQQRLGEMLGRDVTDIDLLKEFSAVIGIGDGKEVRPMSVAEVERYGRSLDEYWERPGGDGEREMFGFFDQITKSMGVRR